MKTYEIKRNRLGLVGIGLLVASMFYTTGCSGKGGGSGDGGDTTLSLCSDPIEASLSDGIVRIGGSTTVVERVIIGSDEWIFYNVANELRAVMASSPEVTYAIEVEGFIHDIEIVKEGEDFGALIAMGEEGITVVDITTPTAMTHLTNASVKVNYERNNITIAEGSGELADINISSSRAPISSLIVYNEGNITDPNFQLIIGDEKYGLHKTSLSNLFDQTNGRELDGTLKVEDEEYTLQYAGENPWGGPKSMTLYGDGNDTRLFVAQGFLGMGIYDPKTLDHVGHYNLYTDATEDNNGEDWFYDMNVSQVVQNGYIDSCTGMPDYNQAAYEITTYKTNQNIDTPWADFEHAGGKYYYDARKVDVGTDGDGKTIAYIAYGMAGVVAVDVTNYNSTTDGCTNTGKYLGYVPAIPAHGPDDRLIGHDDTGNLLSRAGAGMLKDGGVADIKVDSESGQVFYVDHFGGLMVVGEAHTPDVDWHGPEAPYLDNDTNVSVDHVPSYDFVTSYDMSPLDINDDESLPTFVSESPVALYTGEIGGHGTALDFLVIGSDREQSGTADVVVAAGAGGLSLVDLYLGDGLDYNITAQLATTDELAAGENNETTVSLSVGHSAGVGTYDNLLYLADGPHGTTVWKVADESCNNIPAEDVRLVGNTLQSEDPYILDENTTIYPTPHADEVIVINDGVTKSALVSSLSAGLRRVNVDDMGIEDSPKLLYPTEKDIYQHGTDSLKVATSISYEDRVYDVAVRGDLAFTADGLAGVTVYDLSKTPDLDNTSGFLVGNIKVGTNATGIELWGNYAFVASGSKGISIIDISDPSNMIEIQTFEPIKWEDLEENPKAHDADGIAVDVKILDDFAFFTYDSFGVLAYRISDLIVKPVNALTGDRPEAVGYFKVQNSATYTNNTLTDFTEWGGGASGIDAITTTDGKRVFYIAYGDAGVFKLDWSNLWTSPAPTNHGTISPVLEEHVNTSGTATDVSVWNGRVYVADGAGGLVLVK